MTALSRAEKAVTAAGELLQTHPILSFEAGVMYVLASILSAIAGRGAGDIQAAAVVDAMNDLAAHGGLNRSGFIIRKGVRFEVVLEETSWCFRVEPHEEARA